MDKLDSGGFKTPKDRVKAAEEIATRLRDKPSDG
jgi:hypothetical protein